MGDSFYEASFCAAFCATAGFLPCECQFSCALTAALM